MAVFLFLVASLGGVVVDDLLLENPTAGGVAVFSQPVSGYRQGVLLAMAAALGSVVAVLVVASMTSTRARPAGRKQLRTIRSGTQRQAAAPAREQTSLLDEWLGRHMPPATSASQPDEPRRSRSCRAIERIRHVLQTHQRGG